MCYIYNNPKHDKIIVNLDPGCIIKFIVHFILLLYVHKVTARVGLAAGHSLVRLAADISQDITCFIHTVFGVINKVSV